MAEVRGVLKYGDAISFATHFDGPSERSYLSGTGFSDLRVVATRVKAHGSVVGSFRNCAWLVVPAEAHSAASFHQHLVEELQRKQRLYRPQDSQYRRGSSVQSHRGSSVTEPAEPDEEVAEELARAAESVEIERAQNQKQAQQREGTPVRYGEEVQLLHVNSGKYITAKPNRLAESNAESVLCELDVDGTDDSHFTIIPRYKYRRWEVQSILCCVLANQVAHSVSGCLAG